MKPFTKILVPIDFTTHAAEAVRRAVELARHYGAGVTLCYVYEPADYPLPSGYIVYTPEQLERVTQEIQKRLEAARKDAEAVSGGAVPISTRLLQGSAALSIIDLASDEKFDLIVMGTHGRTGVGRLLMGSVAEKVVRAAPCSVLTVKAAEPS